MKTKRLQILWNSVLVAGLSLGTVYGQPTPASTANGGLSNAERAANLYGRQLVGADNQNLGKINNVIVDLESEHILYVVVDTSRGKVAVPPQVIGQTAGNVIHANITKQKLEAAPQFTGNASNPAQLGQASFIYPVYQYFGAKAWWQGKTPPDQGSFHNVHPLNQLIGMNVQDVNNQNIGKISNVVVDMTSGRLLYVVFSPAANLNLGANLYAMPSDAFTLGSNQNHLVTNIDRQKLAAAPHFAPNSWPNIKDSNFASQVYQYYGKQAWFNNGAAVYQPTGR